MKLETIIAAVHAKLEAARLGQFSIIHGGRAIQCGERVDAYDPTNTIGSGMDGNYSRPLPILFMYAPDYRGESGRDYWHVSTLGFDASVDGCVTRALAAYPAAA